MARAKMQLIKEERAQTAAAHRIKFGGVVSLAGCSKMARAKMQILREEQWHACSCGGIVSGTCK